MTKKKEGTETPEKSGNNAKAAATQKRVETAARKFEDMDHDDKIQFAGDPANGLSERISALAAAVADM